MRNWGCLKRLGCGVSSSLVAAGLMIPSVGMAKVHLSELPVSEGHELVGADLLQKHLKLNSRHSEALGELGNEDPSNSLADQLGGFNELVPYVLASPDQEDAGSCLYMAITGIAEWWLARLNHDVAPTADGPLDLSERYIMNVAGMEEDDTHLPNWRTDSIYLFNQNGNKSLLNTSYRYTKGWFLGDEYSDHLTVATEQTAGAQYGTLFNWIDQRPQNPQGVVKLPTFARDVLFADKDNNEWNVGVAPDDIAEQVKARLRTQKAPVLVVYNQNSYWHAVSIVGYNDEMDNGNCDYTQHFRQRISDRAAELDKEAAAATDPTVKSAYEIRAKRAHEAKDKIELAYATKGGCSSSKGVFYIRDSIYPYDASGPVYTYDPTRPEGKGPYAKKIVFKEYDWLRYFANHISVVYPTGYTH